MGKNLDGKILAIAGESAKSAKISPSKILCYTVIHYTVNMYDYSLKQINFSCFALLLSAYKQA